MCIKTKLFWPIFVILCVTISNCLIIHFRYLSTPED